jgi:alpha/beta superfamily hydrolase
MLKTLKHLGQVVPKFKSNNKDGGDDDNGYDRGKKRSNSLSGGNSSANRNRANSDLSLENTEVTHIPRVVIARDMSVQTEVSSCTVGCGKRSSALKKLALVLLHLLGLYLAGIAVLLCSPKVQSALLYLNLLNFPLGDPKNLAAWNLFSTRNIHVVTADNHTLYGYHVMPSATYSQLLRNSGNGTRLEDAVFDEQLSASERVILYLHGNALNRAHCDRVHTVQKLADMFSAHVVAFDYSGFGDSLGGPTFVTEADTHTDAIAMMFWIDSVVKDTVLNSKQKESKRPYLYVYGHSLGAAIGVQLVEYLEANKLTINMVLAGQILDSPFTSVAEVAVESPTSQQFPIFRNLGAIMLVVD